MLSMSTGYGRAKSMPCVHQTDASHDLYIAGDLHNDGAMKNPAPLAARLAACQKLPGSWLTSYDALITRLRRSDAMAGAPRLGDIAPDFALPDAHGTLRRLSDLLAEGPAVLSFNRGSWCPFCQEEIGAWAENRDALIAAGGRLIIITPETGGRLAGLAEIAGERAVVLCDPDLGVALRYGLAFPVGPSVLQQFHDEGFDLTEEYGTASGLLPAPATYLLDRSRQVHFAFVEADFRQRAEPAAVLCALSALKRPS
jgi:peroxiredoxin